VRLSGSGDTFYIDEVLYRSIENGSTFKVYENNRAEQSHESTRMRERGMRKFKSARQAQQFLMAHAATSNVFNLGIPMSSFKAVTSIERVRAETV
jgi:transposase-like protein